MARQIAEEDLNAIVEVVRNHPAGVASPEIATSLQQAPPPRTLQYHLRLLVQAGRLIKTGTGRWTTYRLPDDAGAPPASAWAREGEGAIVPLSQAGEEIRAYLARPPTARKPVGYDRTFLDVYKPGVTAYLTREERARLAGLGRHDSAAAPAGTYARQILNRLLIDLSWNSSRLEGNTYSLLDTRRLIEFGEEAETSGQLDAQMILNHKDAIEFLVESVDEIGFNRHTLLNLHALLANNLLADPSAVGRLRHIAVGIERSAFLPLEVPQLIEECFNQLLETAAAIDDPFEQSFFAMVQLPYLQPFDDVNKRVSRLAANIPLIRSNFVPLTFTDVPRALYTDAMLGVYELNRVELLRDVFVWAYERSSARHAAVRQSLGDPDPFRLRYRDALRDIVAAVVRARMSRMAAAVHIVSWTAEHVAAEDRERFREIAESELLSLHDGNYARYRIRAGEFEAWCAIWGTTPD
jgi:hypothetical protein